FFPQWRIVRNPSYLTSYIKSSESSKFVVKIGCIVICIYFAPFYIHLPLFWIKYRQLVKTTSKKELMYCIQCGKERLVLDLLILQLKCMQQRKIKISDSDNCIKNANRLLNIKKHALFVMKK